MRPNYERNLYCCITNYESDNKEKNIDEYFGHFLIIIVNENIFKSELFYTKSQQFHTSIDQLASFEFLTVIHILADNWFKHRVTSNYKTTLPLTITALRFQLIN